MLAFSLLFPYYLPCQRQTESLAAGYSQRRRRRSRGATSIGHATRFRKQTPATFQGANRGSGQGRLDPGNAALLRGRCWQKPAQPFFAGPGGLLLHLFDRVAQSRSKPRTGTRSTARPSPAAGSIHRRQSWVFDQEPFNVNQFAHPYPGATTSGLDMLPELAAAVISPPTDTQPVCLWIAVQDGIPQLTISSKGG